eukprot:10758304-Alexandrium_andersonii.AAC.1
MGQTASPSWRHTQRLPEGNTMGGERGRAGVSPSSEAWSERADSLRWRLAAPPRGMESSAGSSRGANISGPRAEQAAASPAAR